MLLTSSLGTRNILELARKYSATMLFTSSSEVYGQPEVFPQSENYTGNVNPVGYRSPYEEGKRFSESLIALYVKKYKLDAKIVRIFNTYGPKMAKDDGRVVSNFIVQALNGQDITIYGDGSQTRSFCFVDDLVNGLIKMMGSSDEVTGPINLGNPKEITVKELAEKVISLTGSHSVLIYKDLMQDDPSRRKPDITKAKELLDWEPKIDLEEGLKRLNNFLSTNK